MFTFKIVEENENDLDKLIEKGNLTTRFTLRDVKDHLEYTRKTLEQTKAQLEAEKMQDKIALELMPILEQLPEDKWKVVSAYAQRQLERPVSEMLIQTAEETIKSYTEQIETIKNELGLSIEEKVVEEKVVETPIEEVSQETNG